MEYYFVAGDRLILLDNFTATMPQEEVKFQTFIDRTDELPTGRMIPGEFSWQISPGQPEISPEQKFRVVTNTNEALLCKAVTVGDCCTGTVLECAEVDAVTREKLAEKA